MVVNQAFDPKGNLVPRLRLVGDTLRCQERLAAGSVDDAEGAHRAARDEVQLRAGGVVPHRRDALRNALYAELRGARPELVLEFHSVDSEVRNVQPRALGNVDAPRPAEETVRLLPRVRDARQQVQLRQQRGERLPLLAPDAVVVRPLGVHSAVDHDDRLAVPLGERPADDTSGGPRPDDGDVVEGRRFDCELPPERRRARLRKGHGPPEKVDYSRNSHRPGPHRAIASARLRKSATRTRR
mmetsp:Transcript_10599/g.35119  ORF Transcript_10599/g.35119 Transcript_10599/m.35119 type:complete len:241 (-) Transcript_10599:78-800(-)